MDNLMSIRNVADLAGVSPQLVYRAVNHGDGALRLMPYQPGMRYFKRKEVMRWLRARANQRRESRIGRPTRGTQGDQ